MGFDEMSNAGNFCCPLVIIKFFKYIVLVTFGLVRGHIVSSISLVAHLGFSVWCRSSFELKSYDGLEVCSQEEVVLVNCHYPACSRAGSGSIVPGETSDQGPNDFFHR